MRHSLGLLILAFTAAGLFGQIPLPGSSSSAGGSTQASSIRAGLLAAIPATCTGGAGASKADVYYATDASIVTGTWKIYVCTATNTWTATGLVAGPSGALDCSLSAVPNQTMCDIVAGIFGLIAGNNSWTGNNTFSTGTFSVAGATHTNPQQVVATDPVTCTVGEKYTDTTTSPALDYSCLTTNTWTRVTPTATTDTNFFPLSPFLGTTNDGAFFCGTAATSSNSSGFADPYCTAGAVLTTAYQWAMMSPPTMPTTMTVKFPVFIGNTAAGDVGIRVTIGCRNPVTTGFFTAAGFSVNSGIVAYPAPGTNNLGFVVSAALTTSTCPVSSQMWVKLERVGGDASDTYPNDVSFHAGSVSWSY